MFPALKRALTLPQRTAGAPSGCREYSWAGHTQHLPPCLFRPYCGGLKSKQESIQMCGVNCISYQERLVSALSTQNSLCVSFTKFHRRIYKGIPLQLRGEVWALLLEIPKMKEETRDLYSVSNCLPDILNQSVLGPLRKENGLTPVGAARFLCSINNRFIVSLSEFWGKEQN